MTPATRAREITRDCQHAAKSLHPVENRERFACADCIAAALAEQVDYCWEPGHTTVDGQRERRVHCVQCTDAALAEQRAALAEARRALEEYGRHQATCLAAEYRDTMAVLIREGRDCDCGWLHARAARGAS